MEIKWTWKSNSSKKKMLLILKEVKTILRSTLSIS